MATYPTGGTVEVSYPDIWPGFLDDLFGSGKPATAEVKITYKTASKQAHRSSSVKSSKSNRKSTDGEGKLLMLALPHHLPLLGADVLKNSHSLEAQDFYHPVWCIKGKLTPVVGTTWRLRYDLPSDLGWTYTVAEEVPTSRLQEIADSLLQEVKEILPSAKDSYSFGKELGRMAMLGLIGDYLGIAEVRRAALGAVEVALRPWLEGSNPNALLYDETYGGLVTTNGLSDFMADFGEGEICTEWYDKICYHVM